MRTPFVDLLVRAPAAPSADAAEQHPLAIQALLVAIGSCALAAGLLLYVMDRDPARAQLFPHMAPIGTGPVFGAAAAWLPSFLHPFAFSLLSAATLRRTVMSAYAACAGWWVVNLAFELGQHAQLSGPVSQTLQDAFGSNRLTQALSQYFMRGRFDAGDMVAATAGALAAAAVLHLAHRLEDQYAP